MYGVRVPRHGVNSKPGWVVGLHMHSVMSVMQVVHTMSRRLGRLLTFFTFSSSHAPLTPGCPTRESTGRRVRENVLQNYHRLLVILLISYMTVSICWRHDRHGGRDAHDDDVR